MALHVCWSGSSRSRPWIRIWCQCIPVVCHLSVLKVCKGFLLLFGNFCSTALRGNKFSLHVWFIYKPGSYILTDPLHRKTTFRKIVFYASESACANQIGGLINKTPYEGHIY